MTRLSVLSGDGMYDVSKLLPLFTSILGESKEYANQEFYFYCPFCHHYNPKLAINLGKGKWHCWKCGAAGNRLISLLKKLDVASHQILELREILHEELIEIKKSGEEIKLELFLPREAKPMWIPTKEIEYKHAIHYLINRGLSREDILRYNLHYSTEGTYRNRIIIPSYDETGKLNFFTGRDFFETSHLKYKNPPVSKNIVGFEYHINWNYPIVLCEGVMDAISIKWNAIPLFGKTVSKKLKQKILEQKVRNIYISLDSDATEDAIKIAQEFMKEGQTVYLVRLESKDPSQLGFNKMRMALKEANPLSFKEVLSMKLS